MHSIRENKLIKELSLLVICTLALSCAWFAHFPLCHNFRWHPVLALFTACLEHSQLLSFSAAPNEDKSSRIQPPTEAQKPALHHIVSCFQTKSHLLWDSGANVGVQERSTADLSVVNWMNVWIVSALMSSGLFYVQEYLHTLQAWLRLNFIVSLFSCKQTHCWLRLNPHGILCCAGM